MSMGTIVVERGCVPRGEVSVDAAGWVRPVGDSWRRRSPSGAATPAAAPATTPAAAVPSSPAAPGLTSSAALPSTSTSAGVPTMPSSPDAPQPDPPQPAAPVAAAPVAAAPATRAAADPLVLAAGHRSTSEDRLRFRQSLGWRYDAATRWVARLLAECPGLRAGAPVSDEMMTELAAVRVFAGSGQVDLVDAIRSGGESVDWPYVSCLAGGLQRLPTCQGSVVRGGPAGPAAAAG